MKNKKFNRKLLFAIGDRIRHPRYGEGTIRKIDSNHEFFYDVDFTGNKGNGSKIWLPKQQTEKVCKKIG